MFCLSNMSRMGSVQQIVYVERSTSSNERVADMSRGPARGSATIRPAFLQHVSDKHVGSMMIIDGAFGPASIAMMSSLIVTPSTGSHWTIHGLLIPAAVSARCCWAGLAIYLVPKVVDQNQFVVPFRSRDGVLWCGAWRSLQHRRPKRC